MFRIDDATAATSLPTPEAAGTEGYFTEGNPTAGVPATNVRGSWLNMIQEELRAVVVAGGLTPSKTTYNQLLLALRAMFIGRVKRTVFTASGTYTPSAGLLYAEVEVIGAGGGGATGSSSNAAGGGAAGAYCKAILSAATIGASQTVTVGAGGAAGAAAGNGGSGGSPSSFGSLIVCGGGSGGSLTASTPTIGQPSGGGSVTTSPAGSIAVSGAFGRYGFGSSSVAVGGDGASTIYSSGANGAGTGAGSTGSGFGGGGGGSHTNTGGVGRPGVVIVTEYLSQ
ncbi:glycine-rich domain-containing protein [Caballeronia sp. LZ028]|uniref:glycine-rich domain-containing protein n=1 Tax=Caballeronia sp. LZ028 TaxID=3038563 RepID=UPI00285D138D|nr:hypothetical protein [Caballeronia sp. LZ028]MDR5765050.1 hypothetical protein [Caballeronia sp. LZ028]